MIVVCARFALVLLLAGCVSTARVAPAISEVDEPLPPLPPVEESLAGGTAGCSGRWELWERYAERFVDNGRVIDWTDGARSTSEGQSYGLFFALVADDRARFDSILSWTHDNLAGGDLAARLPAWLWGKNKRGRWKVLDPNPASDADLWIAYSLVEAERLWGESRYGDLGRAMLERVASEEVRYLPGLGAVLLPAPRGFELEAGSRWR